MPDQTRIAIITGANRGLGFETARQLAQQGFRVYVTGRDEARARAAADKLAEDGLDAVAAVLDVASDESVDRFARDVLAELPRVDVLVNNAGAIVESSGGALDVSAATVLESLNTNTLGAYRVSQRVLPRMNDAGYGRIVNVSSGMGALTDMGSGWPAYRISKTALHAVTRQFHAAAKPGVKVNAVCPGWVRTEMGGASATRSIPEGAASIMAAATLPDDGPSGAFLRDGSVIDW